MRRARWWLLAVAVVAACANSTVIKCPDGTLCPHGETCAMVAGAPMCATADQIAQCASAGSDVTPCAADVAPTGACHDRVCVPIACGNGLRDPGEVCDDHNQASGDGCAGDCQSDETCGNGTVDGAKLEQCDDHNHLSGDGCSSGCVVESPTWIARGFGSPGPFEDAQLAYDAGRNRVVLFGGNTVSNFAGCTSSSTPSDRTYEWDGTGWSEAATAVHPLARFGGALAYDQARKRLVLFGGISNDAKLGDTWEYDGTAWALRAVNGPSRRSGHALAYDAVHKRVVLFGGTDDTGARDDTWVWDGAWHELSPAHRPSARAGHALVFDPVRGKLVLLGGDTGIAASPTGDTWETDGTDWTRVAASPAQLRRASAAWDAASRRVVTFGGAGQDDVMEAWNGQAWTAIPLAAGSDPGGRAAPALTADPVRGGVVMFSGTVKQPSGDIGCNQYRGLGDLWRWDGAQWSKLTQQGLGLDSVAAGPASALDPETDTLLWFGGTSSGTATSGAFLVYRGRIVPVVATGPSARSDAAITYDRARHRFVMFGGASASATDKDTTWLFDGASWTPVSAPGPSGQPGYAMAYDAMTEKVVMYGGNITDTWEWNGASWTERAAATQPGALADPIVLEDPVHHRVVMAGGDASYGPSSSTWLWDGGAASWTPGPSISAIPGRSNDAMAWNAARGAAELFGGRHGYTSPISENPVYDYRGDVWERGSDGWAVIPADEAVATRYGYAAVPDARAGGVTLYGGYNPNGELHDAWTLAWTSTTPRESCETTVDLDGDGLAGCADPDCWWACTPLCPPGAPATCATSEPHCGDGTCNAALENCRTCPTDCQACPVACGDGVCDASESATGCPGDCTK